MNRRSLAPLLALPSLAVALTAFAPACGSPSSNTGFASPGSGNPGGTQGSNADGGGSPGSTGTSGPPPPPLNGGIGDDSGAPTGPVVLSDGGIACPSGLQCNVACTGGGTTSISGKVYDPAMKNPLYDVAVYVPASALVPLPRGVPTGADECSCGALYQSGAIANATTDETGSFTMNNVPVGAKVPLVIQIGKWRRLYSIDVTACKDNAQPDKSLAFLGTIPAGDTNDNIPDIAVSTGGADTLECLMLRIGLPASEYVAGNATTGHVHVFSGGDLSGGGFGLGGSGGLPESNPMPGAPSSSTSLWDSQADLMPYDIVLLSCEGEETYNAAPANLESYLNVGGRAFASHFQYAWFSGPIDGTSGQTYSAPADWGSNLATWSQDSSDSNSSIGGQLVTTLNGSTKPFSKGLSLQKWLTNVGALGQNAVPAGELSIFQPRYNASVSAGNTPSQPWITADSASGESGKTMYFSFDTPVNAPIDDAGLPNYCGRAVFSDLHVSGDPSINDTGNGGSGLGGGGSPPPGGCDNTNLSPQEKALEFMLFDLSSCVIPDTINVPIDAGLPTPPPPPK